MFRVSTLGRFALDGRGSNDPVPSGVGRKTMTALSRFKKDNRGSVAIIFGFLTIAMAIFIGAAIDMGRWMQARRVTQEAIDSAVLAGLKKYQDSSDTAQAIVVAQANYTYNIAARPGSSVVSDNIAFQLINNNTGMTVISGKNVVFQMPFLGLAGMPTLPLLKMDGTEYGQSKIAVGANTGTSLEISVMIDITGSMNESDGAGSTKIKTVKKAASSLIDIVVWADQSSFTSKVAIVPFSETVNLGSAALADAARGSIAWGLISFLPGSERYSVAGQTFRSSTTCVTERIGSDKYNDVSPLLSPVGRHYSSNGSCPTASSVMPLTNDKDALKTLICGSDPSCQGNTGLQAGGGTAGQMGTAWAWYMLSPNFNTLWPAASQARTYGDLNVLNSKGKPILKKIAILMTDGDYNTAYCNGVNDFQGCPANNGSSQSQAASLCTAMKAKGIEVYTIGAQVSAAAKTFLQSCATPDGHHYYDATDGNKLQQAFIDIAYKLVPPYLVH